MCGPTGEMHYLRGSLRIVRAVPKNMAFRANVSRTVLETIRVLGLTMHHSDSTQHLEYSKVQVRFPLLRGATEWTLHASL